MDLVRGAVDPRGGYVSKILHVKMKESGPIGGARAGRAPPRSANVPTMYLYGIFTCMTCNTMVASSSMQPWV